jgi:putative salt-induced outer membrane protein YdiY
MRVKSAAIFTFLISLLLCPNLFADQITLKNGDRLTGAIERSDGKILVLKTDAIGEVTIQWPAIDGITSGQPLHVGLTGGQMVVGPLTAANGKVEIATKAEGMVTTSKDSVEVIRSDAEQTAYDATIERLRHPHLADFWSGALDTGLSITRGNSSTVSYTLAAKAIRQTERDKITTYISSVYGKNDTTTPAQTIAHQIQGGVRADINFGPRMFAFALTDFGSNELQHLSLQNVVSGGIGYHMIQNKIMTFDLLGGAGYNQEYFSAYTLPNPTPPPPTTAFAALSQHNAEITVAEDFATKLGSRTTFNEIVTAYPNVTGPTGYHISLNSTLATKINTWLGWQLTFNDNYLSNPPFGIKQNDLLISTGLHITFGKPGTP